MADVVRIAVVMENVAKFLSDANRTSKGIKDVGDTAEKTGKQAGLSWKSLAKWGGIATAAYGAQRFLRGAVAQTEELGKSTLALSRTTGMDVQTSSEWASVIKVRGIQTKQFQMGLVALSRQIEKTRAGTKKHNSALEQLGFTSKDVAIRQGDTEAVLERVSNRFSQMTNPAKRAALAQTLFSRSGQALAPILFKGSKAIREQLGLANKYGASLSGKNAKAISEEIQHQRELKFAYMGLQVQLGQALLPIMLAVTRVVVSLARALSPLTKNATLLRIALGSLVVLFVAYKVAMIAATFATTAFNVSLGLTAVYIGLVIIALAAIGIAAYLVVKHWGAIKAAALRTWSWIKKNWPLLVAVLLGPFAIAVVEIAKHWDAIKRMAKAAIDFVIRQLNRLKNLPGRVLGKIPGAGLVAKGAGLAGRVGGFFGQHGGVVPYRSPVLVGERGPEMLSLPGGAQIAPLPVGTMPSTALGGGPLHLTTQLVVERRVLAETVAQYTADQLARR